MTDEQRNRAAIIVSCLVTLLIVPAAVVVVLFYRNRRHPVAFKSRPLLCVLVTSSTCVGSLIVQPLWFLGKIGVLDARFVLANAYTAGFTWFVTFWAVAVYGWLLHYDIAWNIADTNRTWKEKLNPDASNNDWYILNKQRFGTLRSVVRKTWMIPVGVAIETTVMNHLWWTKTIPSLVSSVNFGVVGLSYFIFIFVVWFRMPVFHDVFNYRSRFRWYVTVMMLNFISLLCSIPVVRARHVVAWLYACLGFGVTTSGITLYSFIVSPLLIIRKYNSPEATLQRLAHDDVCPKDMLSRSTVIEKLSSMSMFSAFMLHLSRELSVENMLFLTELTQFKEDLLRRIRLLEGVGSSWTLDLRKSSVGTFVLEIASPWSRRSVSGEMDTDVELSTTPTQTPATNTQSSAGTVSSDPDVPRWMLKLPNEIPSSNIFSNSTDLPVVSLVEFLYSKYISNHAKLEINISWDARQNILTRMSLLNIDSVNATCDDASRELLCDTLGIFDQAEEEIFRLVQRSFVSFSLSDAYLEVQEG